MRIHKVTPLALLISLWLALTPLLGVAQEEMIPYTWESAHLALGYPAGWEAPFPAEQEGRQTLDIAQVLAAQPALRPPDIPVILLTLLPPPADAAPDPETGELDINLTPYLLEALQAQALNANADPIETTLAGLLAVTITASSADGTRFGIGHAMQAEDGRILIVVGRAPMTQRGDFVRIYNQVSGSLVFDADSTPTAPRYGVLWHTESAASDGESAFISLAALTYSRVNNRLVVVDGDLGVLLFDAQTGAVVATYPADDIFGATDAALDSGGTIYIADPDCGCLHVVGADGQPRDPIVGFGTGAPLSVAADFNGAVYATDVDEAGNVRVRVFNQGVEQGQIALDADTADQPQLALDPRADGGQVLALLTDGTLLALVNDTFETRLTLNLTLPLVNDVVVDANGNLVLATADQGILVVDANGDEINRLGRIVPISPLPGELVNPRGVAIGADGTVYYADSDGSFGALTALSARVAPDRIGAAALRLNTAVQGLLTVQAPQQAWTYDGQIGERLTIAAVDASRADALDVALHLLAPDGSEIAYNDTQDGIDLYGTFDAQIANFDLPLDGTYTIIVERVDGEGIYSLGITREQTFTLNTDAVTQLNGALADAFPTERWTFIGTAGQVFTLTMQADSGTLDPLLRLVAPDGALVDENDDAADPELGTAAQLVQVQLPMDGIYTLEAARFDGEGHYTILIVATS